MRDLDIAQLGTVLAVWAHPDDEAYLAGGLMALAADAGSRVVCVTATRGEHGTADPLRWPPDRLGAVRERELAASLAALGVEEHRWLGIEDGACATASPIGPVATIARIIREVRADTVVTFGPDGMTGHPDHRTVSAWATSAVRRSRTTTAPRLLYAAATAAWCDRFDALHRALGIFPPGLPPRIPEQEVAVDLVLPDDLLDRKLAALRAHASQVLPVIDALGEATFRSWIAGECFRPA